MLSETFEEVTVLSAVLRLERAPPALVPIAIDRVELVSVAEDRALEVSTAFEEATLTLLDSVTLVLSPVETSATTTLREPEALAQALSALETWALVGVPPSTTREDIGAERITARLVALLASTVVVLRFELSTR